MKEDGLEINEWGTHRYYLNGELHREDGPPVIYKNGNIEWFQNGLLHREDGPAIELPNGDKEWYQNGKKHRDDGPAIESSQYNAWYINGKRHRLDGPAFLDLKKGYKEWWYQGEQVHCLSQEQFEFFVRKEKLKTFWWDIMKNGLEIDEFGNKRYYLNGRRHRDDGPAVESKDGSEFWLQHGVLHRIDGPAVILNTADKYWFYQGKKNKL